MLGNDPVGAAGDKGCHIQGNAEGENRLRMRLGEVESAPADDGVILHNHRVTAFIAHNEREA